MMNLAEIANSHQEEDVRWYKAKPYLIFIPLPPL